MEIKIELTSTFQTFLGMAFIIKCTVTFYPRNEGRESKLSMEIYTATHTQKKMNYRAVCE